MFAAWQPVLFSPKISRLNCASLRDSSLLIVGAKGKRNHKFSVIVRKSKVTFLLEVIVSH